MPPLALLFPTLGVGVWCPGAVSVFALPQEGDHQGKLREPQEI